MTRARLGPDDWEATWSRCWHRIGNWRVPARWSASDWCAEGLLAACQSDRDFDSTRGVPHDAFFYQRFLARVWTRDRQEWVHGRPLRARLPVEDCPVPDGLSTADDDREEVDRLLSRLGERDGWLIRRRFWDGKTKTAVAADLGISQQAVSPSKSRAWNARQRRMGWQNGNLEGRAL